MFNKETEYAFRGLVYVFTQNRRGSRPGVIEIAQGIEAPQFYTGKIMQRLVRQGFLNSIKGKNGGFYLDAEMPDRSLRDIVLALEGESAFHACLFGLKNCNANEPCPLHHRYAKIKEDLNELVTVETIRSLTEKMLKEEDREFGINNLKQQE